MSAQSEPPRATAVEPPRKGFTELVREGYVMQGIGLPMAAYVFHAVKLCLFVLGWMGHVSLDELAKRAPWDYGET